MKFKIYNKTTKITAGPFSMTGIRAYDGESHDIWFENETDSVLIGDDLGHGRNNTEKIQDNLAFLPWTGLCDINGIELYMHDQVEFIEDKLFMIPDRGYITSNIDGTWKIVTFKKNVMINDMFDVTYYGT